MRLAMILLGCLLVAGCVKDSVTKEFVSAREVVSLAETVVKAVSRENVVPTGGDFKQVELEKKTVRVEYWVEAQNPSTQVREVNLPGD